MEVRVSEHQSSEGDPGRGVTRRRLLKTAAVAAPIVILATPAPAFALTACGNVAFPTGWTVLASGVALGTSSFSGAVFTNTNDPSWNSSTSSLNPYSVTVTKSSIAVTPGVHYTFNFSAQYNYGANNSTISAGAYVIVTVGGATMTLSTRASPGVLMGPSTYTYYPFSLAFTAAASTVTVTFDFRYVSANPSNGWDDIRLQNAMLRC